jgi:hypothetical protein
MQWPAPSTARSRPTRWLSPAALMVDSHTASWTGTAAAPAPPPLFLLSCWLEGGGWAVIRGLPTHARPPVHAAALAPAHALGPPALAWLTIVCVRTCCAPSAVGCCWAACAAQAARPPRGRCALPTRPTSRSGGAHSTPLASAHGMRCPGGGTEPRGCRPASLAHQLPATCHCIPG